MIDSTNVRVLADNISKLWDKIKSISGDLLPSRSTATTGQILKLTGENKTPAWADEYSYTPPAYSETEVNTGRLWVDGKEVFEKAVVFTFPVLEAQGNVTLDPIETNLNLISLELLAQISSGNYNKPLYTYYYAPSTGVLGISSISTAYSEANGIFLLRYTKPDPDPETRDDDTPEDEPEEKKVIRKRSK